MAGLEGSIFFIGAGSMAEALIRGITERKAMDASNIYVTNRNHPERLDQLKSTYGVVPASDFTAVADSRFIVLAAKPGDCGAALQQAAPYLHGQVVISLAAGLPIEVLREAASNKAGIVRTMPNMPVAVQSGVTGVSFGEGLSSKDRSDVLYILSQIGEAVEIPESMMDSITAVSGSGPGFVCYFLEAMEDAAVALGFDVQTARSLLLATVVGTAKTLSEWQLSPKELRKRVTSPNGTTYAGVSELEAGGVDEAIGKALLAAAARSAEMARVYSQKPAE